jgi:Raf kinase inhibitor-like YbhB/YbcL family protein
MISLSLRHLMLVLVLFHCVVTLGYAAPAEGKKGKGKGGVPAGSVDSVAAAKPSEKNLTFKLTSPAVKDGEKLPVEFTGDGDGTSPPLSWSGVPKGTQSLVLIMHHLDPEGKTKIYWLMYDIDPQTTSVAKNATDFGKMGISTVHNRVEYASPHSKGPGEKKYVLTLFALSAKPDLTQAESPLTVDPLLAAMKGKILAAADLTVLYTRPAGTSDSKEAKRPPRREEGAK